MKRLFVFGCSLTYYSWPTWADIISTGFDEYYNFGVMGMGNQFIHHTIYEADSIFNFTSDDTVLVMFTNPFRNDSFILDPQDNNLRWQARGFIYQPSNDDLYTDHWRGNFWSPEHSYMSMWLAMKSAKQLLDSKNITYRLLSGISCQNSERTGPVDVSNHQFISPYYNQILEMFHVKEPFFDWANLTFDKSEFYTFADTGADQHPTIKMHGSYVMQFLPEFCTEHTVKYIELLANDIDLSSHEKNWHKPAFSSIRGKKVGSVLNWQYMVTNAVGNEVFSQ
jgi:hypothetical protein